MEPPSHQVTLLLQLWSQGDESAQGWFSFCSFVFSPFPRLNCPRPNMRKSRAKTVMRRKIFCKGARLPRNAAGGARGAGFPHRHSAAPILELRR
jgi:hypothetical protein